LELWGHFIYNLGYCYSQSSGLRAVRHAGRYSLNLSCLRQEGGKICPTKLEILITYSKLNS
ncbi:MAG TPA: hypothetical protein VK982_05655, partial [Bacteroidales bacterium]|nr:hypothetical protein [Bacteroidales bacterium]